MSFAFLKKALGLKKGADEKELWEFLRHFDSGDNAVSQYEVSFFQFIIICQSAVAKH